MKYIWEEEDIVVGRWADHPDKHKNLVCISYRQPRKEPVGFGIVDIGTDGLFVPFNSKDAIAQHLTKHGYVPCDKIVTRHPITPSILD